MYSDNATPTFHVTNNYNVKTTNCYDLGQASWPATALSTTGDFAALQSA